MKTRLVLAIAACLAWSFSTGVDTAGAIITKGRPIVIETTRVSSTTSCTFVFGYLVPVANSTSTRRVISDTGSCMRTALRSPTSDRGQLARRVWGTEQLNGHHGTLLLHFDGSQQRQHGHWTQVTGNWSIVGAIGGYTALTGRGYFVSDETFTSLEYHGLLITAR